MNHETIGDRPDYGTWVFEDEDHRTRLTAGHNSTVPGIHQERAIQITVGTKSDGVRRNRYASIALSVDAAAELKLALGELIEEAAPLKRYVVEMEDGAYVTTARDAAHAHEIAKINRPMVQVGHRVWAIEGPERDRR